MGILGKYFVQGSFGKTEIKKSSHCYHATCDLSDASLVVYVHVHNTQGQIYMLPVLAVFRTTALGVVS